MGFPVPVMNVISQITRWAAPVFLLGAGAAMGAGGVLPALQERPWEGYFVAHMARGYQFGIGCDAEGNLEVRNRKGDPMGHTKALAVRFTVEETMPDGKVVARQLDPESLATTDKPTTKPETIKFTGKVTGGASFEATATFDGERMELGGRVVDPGGAKNPLRFAIRVTMREIYKGAETEGKQFQRKVEDDEVRFETIDGKRGKIEMAETVDVAKETGKAGVRMLRMEAAGYEGRRFEFSATEGSAIEIRNTPDKPLIEGATFTWRPDPVKDPQGKARLVIEIR